VTEVYWYSNPPTSFGWPLAVQARYIEQSLYLFWKDGAEVVINFLVQDAPNPESGFIFGTGLLFQDGTPKPAHTAFRFPFVADRKHKRRALAWGKSPIAGELEIRRQTPNGWQTIRRLTVAAGEVFTAKLRIRGEATLQAAIGSDTSLTWDLKR
jgi:hypothetical protein